MFDARTPAIVSIALLSLFALNVQASAALDQHRTSDKSTELPGRIADPDLIIPPGPHNPASGAPAAWPTTTEDDNLYAFSLIDRLEYSHADGPDTYLWDAQGWIGGDYNKLWWKTMGKGPTHGGSLDDTEFQALYNRTIAPFWGLQAGVRYDIKPKPDTAYAVLGVQGLTPYWFGSDTALFISEHGDFSFRGEFGYELLLTQRLILQPRLEINASANDVPELGLGSGINDTEAGLRLRYEIRREFAPYIGVRWERLYGETRNIAQREGESTSSTSFVLGVRIWY